MALSDKNIVITPNTGVGSPTPSDPSIVFSAGQGSPDGALDITLYARPQSSGTLSFEGTAGQLFSITNDLTGTIFSVNDISGIPSIEVEASGKVKLAEFGGNVGIGTGSPAQKLTVVGTVRVYDTGNTDYLDISHDGTDANIGFVNTTDLNLNDGVVFKIWDGGNTDNAAFSHDGADFNTTFTNTADWNITSLTAINAGTVDADFDAITGTTFNSVALTTGGAATNYLDETGNYSAPAGTGDPDQNLWLNMDADSGGPVAANITTDTFTITGSTGITTAISGDSVTISRDTIALTTDTSGNYVATIIGGTGVDSTGATTGEGIAHTLSVDLGEVTAVVFDPAVDFVPIIDGGITGTTQKDAWSDIATLIAGTNITATAGVLSVAAPGDADQNLFLNVLSDSGTAVADTTTDTLSILGGTGISTAVVADALTITQDTITLGTNTAGDFVGTITGGVGIDSTGATTGEDIDHTLSVDLGEVTAVVFDPAVDFIPIIDGGITGTTQKDAWSDIATAIAGTGITATSGVLAADNVGTVTGTGTNNQLAVFSGTSSINSSAVLVTNDSQLIISSGAPFIQFNETGGAAGSPVWWVGTDGGNWNIRLNNAGPYPYSINTDGTNASINTQAWDGADGWSANFNSGALMRLYDSTDTDYVSFQHDGTDFNILGATTNTTDINISAATAINFQDGAGTQIIFDMANDRSTFTGVLELVEQADHATSPTSGRGQIWVKSGSLGGELMYTEGDQDADFTAYNVIETVYHHDQTVTSADPGAGNMRWDSLTPASVTELYLDDLDETGRDASFLLSNLADSDILTMRSMWSAADYLVCSVNGTPTDNVGWWTIPVTIIHSDSVPATGDPVHITVEWASQSGGAGVTTFEGRSGAVVATAGDYADVAETFTAAQRFDGQVNIDTASNTVPLRISRVGTTTEEALHGVTDSSYDIFYQNDEASATMRFTIDNTDTESGGGADANTTVIDFLGQTAAPMFWLRDGTGLKISDTGDTDFGIFTHDGTDFNSAFTNTTDWNVTGLDTIAMTGQNVASSNTGISIDSRGDAFITLISDNVSDAETNNAYVSFSQDQAAVLSVIGGVGAANIDAQGNTFTGIPNNGFGIHHRYGTGSIGLGVNQSCPVLINDSDQLIIQQPSSGDGVSFAHNGTNFLVTDVSGTAQFAFSGFTAITQAGDITVNTGSVDVDQDEKFFSTRFDLYNTSSDVILHNKGTGAGADTFLTMNNSLSYEGLVVRNLGGVELYYADALKFVTTSHTASDGGTGATVVDGLGTMRPVGFNTIPVYEIDAADTFDLAHNGMLWNKDAGAAVTYTVNNDASIPQGATYLIHNNDTENLTITGGTATIEWRQPGAGSPQVSDVVIEPGGIVTVYKYSDTEFWAWGAKEASVAGAASSTTITTSTTSSAFKVPFANTTASTTGDYGLLQDSTATFTYNPSTNTLVAGTFSGSGASLTALTAANISAGSLASGVNSYFSVNSTNAAFKVPFLGTTGTSAVNTGMSHDTTATFTYNPSTNTLVAGTFSGSGASLTSLTAANISAGNLVSGVVLYLGANSTNSAFKIPFTSTTAASAGNFGLSIENSASTFTYNPSSGTLVAATFSGALSGNATTASAWATGRTITLTGDVTGVSGAWTGSGNISFAATVGNDTHTHAFNNLTSKASGTGFYATSGQFQAANGLCGTYDDAASGAWGGPIWGMDDGFTGPTGGANALATSCYGIRWNRASSTQAHADIGEGLYVYQNGVIEGGIGTAGIYSAGSLDVTGIATFTAEAIFNDGLQLNDSDVLHFGTGEDCDMYFNGTDMYVDLINGADFRLRGGDTGTNAMITALDDAGVFLYYNNLEAAQTAQYNSAANTSSLVIRDHANVARDAGFNNLKRSVDNPASVAVAEEHIGTVIYADDNTAFAIALPSSTSSFPLGGVITIVNANTSVAITVTDLASYTCFYLDGATRTDIVGTASIAAGGVATVWRSDTTGTTTPCYLMWGSGITP